MNGNNQYTSGVRRQSDHNDEMNLAWRYLSATDTSVFLTGKAGTGKTTFLRRLRQLSPKRMVVLAPTGVAAINAGGQTIHSFFQLPFGPYVPGMASSGKDEYKMSQHKKDLIRSLDLLVIDEISMVRADLLDRIDDAMRRYRDASRPFGGVQLLLIGDLMQLAPVAKPDEWGLLQQHYATPYFFSSRALSQIDYVTIELRKIYRQTDTSFIDLLAGVRDGRIDDNMMRVLNSRYKPGICPDGDGWIRLTTHNHMARSYNDRRLEALPGTGHTFLATVEGDFPEAIYPAEDVLCLKKGAQVMFIKNDVSVDRAYYNGKIGTVTDLDTSSVTVSCDDGSAPIKVGFAAWENTKYSLNPATKEIEQNIAGTFSQIPLRLAWAITIHKSQGLTFDKAVLDIDASFSHGQAYVALSRCRSLEGMVLANPMNMSAVITDNVVRDYNREAATQLAQSVERLPRMMTGYTSRLIADLYSFVDISNALRWLIRVVAEHLSKQTELQRRLETADYYCGQKVVDVAARFAAVCSEFVCANGSLPADSHMAERVKKSCVYFDSTLTEIFGELLENGLDVEINNKQTENIYDNAVASLQKAVAGKHMVLKEIAANGFTTPVYLDARARASLMMPAKPRRRKDQAARPLKTKKAKKPKSNTNTYDETYRLYEGGLDIEDIAKKRGLALSTIAGHMARLVAEGRVDAADIISEQKIQLITETVESLGNSYTFSKLKESLPDDITYCDIRIAMAINGSDPQ